MERILVLDTPAAAVLAEISLAMPTTGGVVGGIVANRTRYPPGRQEKFGGGAEAASAGAVPKARADDDK
jgi:hypothetical protein